MEMWKVERKIKVEVDDNEILVKITYDNRLKTGWKRWILIDSVFFKSTPRYK